MCFEITKIGPLTLILPLSLALVERTHRSDTFKLMSFAFTLVALYGKKMERPLSPNNPKFWQKPTHPTLRPPLWSISSEPMTSPMETWSMAPSATATKKKVKKWENGEEEEGKRINGIFIMLAVNFHAKSILDFLEIFVRIAPQMEKTNLLEN